jgi:hypothetical protein
VARQLSGIRTEAERPKVFAALELWAGLKASCRQLGGDEDVRNTRNPRPYGGLSGDMKFGWEAGIRTRSRACF